jgi:hypothetical protein
MFVGTNRLEAAPPTAKPVFKAGFAARNITPEIGRVAGVEDLSPTPSTFGRGLRPQPPAA